MITTSPALLEVTDGVIVVEGGAPAEHLQAVEHQLVKAAEVPHLCTRAPAQ